MLKSTTWKVCRRLHFTQTHIHKGTKRENAIADCTIWWFSWFFWLSHRSKYQQQIQTIKTFFYMKLWDVQHIQTHNFSFLEIHVSILIINDVIAQIPLFNCLLVQMNVNKRKKKIVYIETKMQNNGDKSCKHI